MSSQPILENNPADVQNIPENTDSFLALLAENKLLKEEIKNLLKTNQNISEKNADQDLLLRGGSKVSSTPPSHDWSTNGRSLKDIEALINSEDKNNEKIKSRGKQRGFTGSGRTLQDDAEKNVHKCKPIQCLNCAKKDTCQSEYHRYSTRHVLDIEIKKKDDVYELYNRKCPLRNDETISGQAPSGVNSSIQFGYTIQILVILLYFFGLSFERIHNFFYSFLGGFSPSVGTLKNITTRFGNCKTLNQVYNSIYNFLSNKKGVLHADETGIRGNKKNFWLHTICDNLFSYCFVSLHRGYLALIEGRTTLIEKGNILVHDCWYAYFKLDKIMHALCNAHIIRDLAGIWLYHKQTWAFELLQLFLDIYRAKKYAIECGLKGFNQSIIDGYKDKIIELTNIGISENPIQNCNDKKRPKKNKAHNVALRIQEHVCEFLAFVIDFRIPFTNNIAEQTIRSAKIKIKNSGYLEEDGAKIYAKIFSVLSTVNKQKMSMFNSIKAILEGNTLKFSYNV